MLECLFSLFLIWVLTVLKVKYFSIVPSSADTVRRLKVSLVKMHTNHVMSCSNCTQDDGNRRWRRSAAASDSKLTEHLSITGPRSRCTPAANDDDLFLKSDHRSDAGRRWSDITVIWFDNASNCIERRTEQPLGTSLQRVCLNSNLQHCRRTPLSQTSNQLVTRRSGEDCCSRVN